MLIVMIVYWLLFDFILLNWIYLYWSINITMWSTIDSTDYLSWSSFYSQYSSDWLSNRL